MGPPKKEGVGEEEEALLLLADSNINRVSLFFSILLLKVSFSFPPVITDVLRASVQSSILRRKVCWLFS